MNGITKATSAALVYATTIGQEVIAVCIEVDKRDSAQMRADWEAWDIGVPLEIVPSPYRSILKPLVEFVENLRMVTPGELVTVVVPEIVPQAVVGASAAQQDGALHPDGVPVQAERRRGGRAVPRGTCVPVARPARSRSGYRRRSGGRSRSRTHIHRREPRGTESIDRRSRGLVRRQGSLRCLAWQSYS